MPSFYYLKKYTNATISVKECQFNAGSFFIAFLRNCESLQIFIDKKLIMACVIVLLPHMSDNRELILKSVIIIIAFLRTSGSQQTSIDNIETVPRVSHKITRIQPDMTNKS
jgi:hypothetical protein